ncbi:conserved hypothetical protein [Hyella patelloides LEGE 07179]|uniref:Uncharacterized protein n=1 Tax=Hyella patelloides LEGE 07179 TaxID=945734 RepID=A0A563W3C9_9CYAN|nr:hypothetical protein [Hyella patelloides]VEP18182.1 conserved hypothetical protein [Hyella patelloides LEGE 07179]
MKYSADDIIFHKNPEIKEMPDGSCQEIWDVIFKKSISENSDLQSIAELSSREDFKIKIELKEGKYLTVTTNWIRNPNPYCHQYSAIYTDKMFENIEKKLSAIDTIQGQKMEDRFTLYKRNKKS